MRPGLARTIERAKQDRKAQDKDAQIETLKEQIKSIRIAINILIREEKALWAEFYQLEDNQ